MSETKAGVATTWAYPATSNRLSTVKQGSTALRSLLYNGDGTVARDTRYPTSYDYGYRRSGLLGTLSVGGVATASYLYDGFSRLAARNVASGAAQGDRRIVSDIFGHVIAEHLVGTGMQREYVWLGDMAVATVDATSSPSKLYYVHVDHLDRPALMTDSSKAVVWKASYEPFGAVRAITGPASLDLRFPGQWFQLESGLAYNWRRHYDPTLGRYVQPDPLGFIDGPSVYGYAMQSPMMKVDPTGLAEITSISGHALGRMQVRGISRAAAEDACRCPIRRILQPNGNTLFIGSSASVVLSPSGRMVTCW